MQIVNLFSKSSGSFFEPAVKLSAYNLFPCTMISIGRAFASADVDHFITGSHQPWDEICPDVPSSANYDRTHKRRLFDTQRLRSSPGLCEIAYPLPIPDDSLVSCPRNKHIF